MEVDYDMEPYPDNFSSVDNTDAGTLFEVHTWRWYGIDCRAVVAQNQNELSFENGWDPKSLSYIDIFLHCTPFKWFIVFLLPSTSRAMKESDIAPLTLGDLLRYVGIWLLIST